MRKIRFSDTSLILTWFSADFGKIKTVAKGALRPKSKFSGVIDLFYECEIQFARSTKSELHTLREAGLLNARDGIRKDYTRVALASYFVELLELTTETDHPAPDLHDLFKRALHHLDEKPPSRRAFDHFEAELARLLGIQNPAATPVAALMRVYHKLPSSRKEILRLLDKRA